MATTIKLKNGSGAPLAGDLVQGEPALDLTNKRLYTEDSGGSVIEVGTNPTSLTTGTFTSTGIDDNATSTAITIDASQNVGIGTSSPAYKLDIDGSSTTNIDLLHLLNSNNTLGCSSGIMFENYSGGGLNQGRIKYLNAGSNNSNSFVFEQEINATNGLVETMRIDSSGNVGINTALPNAKLAFGNASDIAFNTSLGSTGTYASIKAFNALAPTNPATNIRFIRDIAAFGNDGAICFDTVNTERMRIDSSGNVGIGTSSPASIVEIIGVNPKLTINANDVVNGRNATLSLISGTSADPSGTCQIMYGASNSTTSGTLTFVEGDGTTERMRIDSSGDFRVGSGSRTYTVGSGTYELDIAGGLNLSSGTDNGASMTFEVSNSEKMRIDAAGRLLVGTTAGNHKLYVFDLNDRTENTAQFGIHGNGYVAYHWLDSSAYYIGQNSGARSLRMYSGSNETIGVSLGPGGNSWASYSDESLKENISDIGTVLDKVKDYRCVNYSMVANERDAADAVGFIAQDWVDDFPNVVDKVEDDKLMMKYTETIPVLLKAIQEQQAMIEDLRARVAQLEEA